MVSTMRVWRVGLSIATATLLALFACREDSNRNSMGTVTDGAAPDGAVPDSDDPDDAEPIDAPFSDADADAGHDDKDAACSGGLCALLGCRSGPPPSLEHDEDLFGAAS
jgi:hypothetical protein